MQPNDIVVCSDCGSEYQPHVTRCIDCGAPTRPAESGSEPRRKERPPFSLPRESPARGLTREDGLGVAESLCSFLEEHGIPCRIEVSEVEEVRFKRTSYLVCVAEEDLDRASELRHEHMLIENPEMAEEFGDLPAIDQCPACGSRVSTESAECPSCGLTLDANPITSAFVQAADELGFSFEPAFAVALQDGSVIQSLGLVRHFGSELGALLFSESQYPSAREREELERLDYFYSLLFESYSKFDEQLFKDALNDWGFFGNEQERPEWYSGALAPSRAGTSPAPT